MADWKRTVVEVYVALERADDRPSINRAIAMTRQGGHRFTNDAAKLVLRKYLDQRASDRDRSGNWTDRSGETGPATGPSSFIYPDRESDRPVQLERTDRFTEAGPPPSSPSLSPSITESVCEISAPAREDLTLPERARLLCHAVFEIAIDAGFATPDADTGPFIRANEAAARRLVEAHGEAIVTQRYQDMLASQIRGELWKRDPSLIFLERIWDKAEAASRRHTAPLKAVNGHRRAPREDEPEDEFIQSLRTSVKRGSQRQP